MSDFTRRQMMWMYVWNLVIVVTGGLSTIPGLCWQLKRRQAGSTAQGQART